MFLETEGLVLRQTKFNEYDKILTIFSEKKGKIQAIAKGVRKTNSKLIASTQVFCYSEFLLYKGKNFYYINQGEGINSFYPIREDLEKLAYGTYIIELIDAGIVEDEENSKLFRLLIKTLQILSKLNKNYLKLVLAFEIKYISFIGYRPYIKRCVLCNNKLEKEIKFSDTHGGALCGSCFDKDVYGKKISSEILLKMDRLLYSELDKIDEVYISDKDIQIIEKILLDYILTHIDKNNLKSLDFIKKIKKSEV